MNAARALPADLGDLDAVAFDCPAQLDLGGRWHCPLARTGTCWRLCPYHWERRA